MHESDSAVKVLRYCCATDVLNESQEFQIGAGVCCSFTHVIIKARSAEQAADRMYTGLVSRQLLYYSSQLLHFQKTVQGRVTCSLVRIKNRNKGKNTTNKGVSGIKGSSPGNVP